MLGPAFNICRFDTDALTTHVRNQTAGANLAEPAVIFSVSHWNDMNIVIVESPAKAKTINKYLGKNFDVEASLGHVKDLPKSGLSVDVGMREVEVRVKGPGSGRESAIRALQAIGLEISTIKDVTPIPHNGCRPRKKRRV